MSVWPDDTPWRQGHVLTRDGAQALGLKHPETSSEDDTIVVVISHDCDLNQPPDKEPDVEVIIGREIQRANGNFTFGKGARMLHLPFSAGEQKLIVELDARNKALVSKERFWVYNPSAVTGLTTTDLRTLQRWLSSRYDRASFANEFNNRLADTVLKGFEKIIKATEKHLYAIYFDVDEGKEIERQASDDCYILSIYLVYNIEPDIEAAKAAANSAASDIRALFKNKCEKDGKPVFIELRECMTLSEEEMSLYVSRRVKRLHTTDHLSLRDGSDGVVIAE